MANITYNGLTNPTNLITFSDIPNILKVSDTNTGTYATITITVGNGTVTPTSDGEYYINMFGNTITNALSPQTLNKSFYIAPTAQSTAAYIARALRNCPNIVANFSINHTSNTIVLKAYDFGVKLSEFNFSTNLSIVTETHTDGTSSSSLDRALIDVNMYVDGNYVTTLEKNFYDGEVAFNLSPFLTTISEVGKTVPYSMTITSLKDGVYGEVGVMGTNNASVGYMVNQGQKYLIPSDITFAQNVMRNDKQMTLYVYQPTINLSCYMTVNTRLLTIKYLDSAYNEISTKKERIVKRDSLLKDVEIELDAENFNQAFYVDVFYDEDNYFRYTVIKPIKAAEDVQRVYWRNSYGGVSFFDFTGQRSETRDVEIKTYEKSIFDYYESTENVQKKIYDNEVEYEVTLTSHLIDKDGKYIFNDVLQSTKVWTVVNGQTYDIIIKSVDADEVQNDVYKMTLKYNYSQNTTLV